SDAPRWRFISGRQVAVETAVPEAVVAGLEKRGHVTVRETPDLDFGFGGAQLIYRLPDGYIAGSDHRKDGVAIGF
ncbi:MAG: gamma-glutamyltransferase family protein, partial [Pseudomonadota bacterium]|nr:gamma-glutamyltransferase family protein [Pseudomonadota bacterium]